MSNTVKSPDLQDASVAPTLTLRRWGCVVAVIVAVHLPLLFILAKWLTGRSHYQYFPLILLSFVWLVHRRISTFDLPTSRTLTVRIVAYAVFGALIFVLGMYIRSGLLGLVSCLIACWCTVWYFGSMQGVRALRGPFAFFFLLLPLPLNLDLSLINSLQHTASRFASSALDLRGVRHVLSGIVIQTSSKTYFVEEACSGINSLFSATAAVLFFCVFCRYGLVRTVVAVCGTVFWVVMANAARVFSVVYFQDTYGISLETGWRHEALGVLTYCVAVLLSMSTVRFLQFIVPLNSSGIAELNLEFWKLVEESSSRPVQRLLDFPLKPGRRGIAIMLVMTVLVITVVPVISISQYLRQSGATSIERYSAENLHEQLTKDSLPQELGQWVLRDFSDLNRNPNNPFGIHSTAWNYSGNGLNLVFSFDGYYPEWHDLAYCYGGTGWNQLDAENGTTLVNADSTIPHTHLSLSSDSGRNAQLWFSCFDSKRNPVAPPEVAGSFFRMLQLRLRTEIIRPSAGNIVPPVFQVQLIVEGDRELMPHEDQALFDLFVQLREQLLLHLNGGK